MSLKMFKDQVRSAISQVQTKPVTKQYFDTATDPRKIIRLLEERVQLSKQVLQETDLYQRFDDKKR